MNNKEDIVSQNSGPVYNMGGLIEENKMAWLVKNLGSVWRAPYAPYPVYDKPWDNNGIFKIQKPSDQQVSIAILSDWASDTLESDLIAKQVGIQDYSIHLGDTYYVGNDTEIAENFFPERGGTWPYGTLGSFAMMGNHEMYSSGKSYFTTLLPRMGNYKDGGSQVQQAAFFCLENDYWRIIGLDTGYNSLTGALGLTPNTNLELTNEQKSWFENAVKINEDNRGIVILSHHQCFSAFEAEFPNPAKYISSIMSPARDIIWLWGHEHYFSVYGPNKLDNGANVFARCIGNSGMPVELNTTDGGLKRPKNNTPSSPENRNLVMYDQRLREYVNGHIPLGHNGYTMLTLDTNQLTIGYFDDNGGQGDGRKILEEQWSVDLTTGKIKGETITDYTINGDQPAALQLFLFGEMLTDAINP